MRGLSVVAASGGHSSSRCVGLSLSRPLPLRSTGSRRAGSVIVAHGLSCSAAYGIFPDQGSNPCPLHWQADSQPLRHQGSPGSIVLIHLFLFPCLIPWDVLYLLLETGFTSHLLTLNSLLWLALSTRILAHMTQACLWGRLSLLGFCSFYKNIKVTSRRTRIIRTKLESKTNLHLPNTSQTGYVSKIDKSGFFGLFLATVLLWSIIVAIAYNSVV